MPEPQEEKKNKKEVIKVVKSQKDLEKQVYKQRSLAIAGVSAAVAEIITFPIDTSKIYLQMQHTRIKKSKPTDIESIMLNESPEMLNPKKSLGIQTFFRAFQSIYRKQGMKGFYKGWKPAVIRASLNNALSATLYKPVRKLYGADSRDCPLWTKLASGFTTGGVTQILAAPTDLLKVRLQADNARRHPRYKGVLDAFTKIYRQYGIGVFWRGIGPSMGRAGIAVASTFGTYDHIKSILLRNQFRDNFQTHTIASFGASFIATFTVCPIDVVKTRYQAQSISNPIYKTPTDCFKKIIRNEGFITLWRGFWPMYSRLGPWQTMFFVTYEALSIRIIGESF